MPKVRTQIRGIKDTTKKAKSKIITRNASKAGVSEGYEEAMQNMASTTSSSLSPHLIKSVGKFGEAAIGGLGKINKTKLKTDKNGVKYPASAAGKYEIANKKSKGGKISRKFKCGGKMKKKC